MKKSLQEMTVAELQAVFVSDTKRFIEALDDGTPVNLLQPMRERIRAIGQLLDAKRLPDENSFSQSYSSR